MTRTKKVLATVAIAVAAAVGASSPALADNHASVVTPQDNHASVVTPLDNHAS
ncbi:hypothetical protein ABZY09_03595 [Streptomyces sp. NPDC002928]|uniref:hypothetical protein n=1 Tax=Streptomyces sp. NPDC002928 TaxID=3154440 RepID=UPI0033BAFE8D